ncbi:MAG: TetR/AcrR family transcriptional regulator [Candidatus Binatia bacterium]
MRGRKKSEDTRLAILRCASEVFSQRPYHEVLTDEISTRLKMGKGTLYRYFASKEELYFATLVDGLAGMQGAIETVLFQQAPLERTIQALTRTIIGYFWQRRDFFVLLHRHETKLEWGDRVEWQQRREAVVAQVGDRIADELGPTRIDPRLAVEMLFGMIRSVCLYRDETAKPEDLARLVTRVFLSGVRAQSRSTARPVPAREGRRVAAGKR